MFHRFLRGRKLFGSYKSLNKRWYSKLSNFQGLLKTAIPTVCISVTTMKVLDKHLETITPEPEVASLPIEFYKKIKEILGDRIVITKTVLEDHSKDFSYHAPVLPSAVLYVETIEEVSEILKLCNEYKVSLVTFGSGTSLEGHIIPFSSCSISLNMSKMKKILKLNGEDMDVIVQPGITYAELNDELEKHGFFFPLDPGPGASIGGMLGTSCSGTNAVRYGTAKENVLSLKVVLADGTIVNTGTRAKKSSAGYDLTHLFIGSEGTLGVIVEATLKIHKIPEFSTTALCTFDTVGKAARSVIDLIHNNIRLGKVELLDDVAIKAVNINGSNDYTEKPTLIFEFAGTEREVGDLIASTRDIVSKYTDSQFIYATTEDEKEELYRARKEALWAAPVLLDGSSVLITDVCVPISKLDVCLEETQKDIEELNLIAPMVAHAGDGNFHLFVLFDSNNEEHVEKVKELNDRLIKRAILMDGTCTGEHGVGIGKSKYLPLQLGEEAVELMRRIKTSLDPNNILNPGKVIPPKE